MSKKLNFDGKVLGSSLGPDFMYTCYGIIISANNNPVAYPSSLTCNEIGMSSVRSGIVFAGAVVDRNLDS